jgi:hypothetical protein
LPLTSTHAENKQSQVAIHHAKILSCISEGSIDIEGSSQFARNALLTERAIHAVYVLNRPEDGYPAGAMLWSLVLDAVGRPA